jgi:ubiquinone/menaquinone biosynthesis C-methylase UbiE
MEAPKRLLREIDFHDRQARGRAATFDRGLASLAVDVSRYLSHESWIGPAFQKLGAVRGLCALDYGCGHGMAAVVLARRGAHVTAFDLSMGYVSEARRRALANGVTIELLRADAQRLPFGDSSFDRVWGNAVLHHLELEAAARELRRVLRPGGRAVFCEPWAGNPALNLARQWLPYHGKHRTPDEQPLDRRHVRRLQRLFPRVEVEGHQLLGVARRLLPGGGRVSVLDRCDDFLLAKLPALKCWCRYVVLTLER